MDLVRNADLVIHDAQYTPDEFEMKSTWGHCTVEYAVWLAAAAGAKRLALFHHDPTRHDDAVDELLCEARRSGHAQGVEVFAASEGLVVELQPPSHNG
jgi:ribonuclease BN (tRNA processing enzyme)